MNSIIPLSPGTDLLTAARVLATYVASLHEASIGLFHVEDTARQLLLSGTDRGTMTNANGDELLAELLKHINRVRARFGHREGGAA